MEQGSEEWLKWRRQHVCASDFAALMGEDPWRSPADIYRSKVDQIEQSTNKAMERGTKLEPYARRAYQEHTGINVEPIVVEHPNHNIIGASLDGISFDEITIVEIKCPGIKSFNTMSLSGVPRHYWIQVQVQLFCVPNAKECHFFVWKEDDFFMEKIEPDKLFHVELLECATNFWNNHVIPRIEP